MRRAMGLLAGILAAGILYAQVGLDKPLHLVGPDGARTVDSVAFPTSPGSALTVGHATSGAAHWASAAIGGDTVTLALPVPVVEAREGLLLRFLADQDLHGEVFLALEDDAPLPLRRPDGQYPMRGQLREGTVCEVVLADAHFVLTAPEPRGCPPGSLQVNGAYCIDVDDKPGVNFYQAGEYCAKEGGRLCRWDEYHAACTLLEAQLNGLFNGWEWIDNTSDHTHTADRAGSTTCTSQGASGPLSLNQVRCCFTLP